MIFLVYVLIFSLQSYLFTSILNLKNKIFFATLIFVMLMYLFTSFIFALCAVHVFFYLSLFQDEILEFFQRKKLDEGLRLFLDHLVLAMYASHSFRSAYQESVEFVPSVTQRFLKQALMYSEFSQKGLASTRMSQDFLHFLNRVTKSPHKALFLIRSLQSRWSFESSIKEDIRSASFQVRVQACLMVLFFLAGTFWYFAHNCSFYLYGAILLLFLVGCVSHLYLQRGFRWTG